MNDGNGRQLVPVSAVCTTCDTLYMFTKSCSGGRQLVFCDNGINGGTPVFLDIGGHEPVSLFGGNKHSASICSDGEVIFINRNSDIKVPSSQIPSSSLPDGEMATMIACLNESVFALSSSGRVFLSDVDQGSCTLKFSAISELSGIVWLSGTCEHCLAVSRKGRVFGCGSNTCGRLGLGKGTSSVSSFTEISSLSAKKIRAAYAGYRHSLFLTNEGKIFACGWNKYGELLLSSGPSDEYVYSPTETTIKEGATFAVAGEYVSSVFFGGDPPPNTPNTRVKAL